MITIGLTGSIGMGKSTVAKMFAELGALTWSADDAVHRMYEAGGAAIEPLRKLFPEAIVNGAVDRKKLASVALAAPEKLRALEEVVHPLVGEDRAAFIQQAIASGSEALVLDIPLLFENATGNLFDAVIVVSAPAEVQRERVLARPGMTEEKLNAILAQQMPDAEKQKKADYVISTNQSIEGTKRNVAAVFEKIKAAIARPH